MYVCMYIAHHIWCRCGLTAGLICIFLNSLITIHHLQSASRMRTCYLIALLDFFSCTRQVFELPGLKIFGRWKQTSVQHQKVQKKFHTNTYCRKFLIFVLLNCRQNWSVRNTACNGSNWNHHWLGRGSSTN